MTEQIPSAPKLWSELSAEQQSQLTLEFGEPRFLPNVTLEVTGRTTAGNCPGNETALAAMMYVLADRPVDDPMALGVRNRMRDQHSIELIGPFLHFYVDGINPRILFPYLTIDAAGHVFTPGKLYTYNIRTEMENISQLVSEYHLNNVIAAAQTTKPVHIKLELVRNLEILPLDINLTKLQDLDGNRVDIYGPKLVAAYFHKMLINEMWEVGEEGKFYTALLKDLPDIFKQPELVVEISPTRDYVSEASLSSWTDFSKPRSEWPPRKYFVMSPHKTYRAIRNPLDSIYPPSQATFIVEGNDGEYFFVPAYEVEIKRQEH